VLNAARSGRRAGRWQEAALAPICCADQATLPRKTAGDERTPDEVRWLAGAPCSSHGLRRSGRASEVDMALRYLDESEAERLCASTLEAWVTSSGYKGCYSAAETRRAIDDAKLWAKGSTTAQRLASAVETSPKEILVVGMRGGYQCFDSTATDQLQKVPVVFIDLDGRLDRLVRQPHQIHFAPQDLRGHGGTVEAMDNRVALLHELGHAKQWIDNPLFFDNHYKQQKGALAKPQLKIPQKNPAKADPLLHPEGPTELVAKKVSGSGALGASFAQSIQKRAAELWEKKGLAQKGLAMRDPLMNPDGGFLLTVEELEAFQPVTGFSVRIEADNMARHEWPICRELGIPLRVNYRDIGGTSTATASRTSALLKRQADASRSKVDMPQGGVKCPYCDFTKSNVVFVNNHIREKHKGQPSLG
jgi:hypothetical protein